MSTDRWMDKEVVVHIHNGIFSSVQFSHLVMSDSLRPHQSQHARPLCPSPTPKVQPNSCPLSWCCHWTILSSVRWLINTWIDAQHHSLLEECKSKTTMRYHLTLDRMTIIKLKKKNSQITSAGEGVKKRELYCTAGGDVNWYSHYGRQYGDPLKNQE